MTQDVRTTNRTPKYVTAENSAVAVPAAGNTELLSMIVEGTDKASFQIVNATQALDAFIIKGRVHRNVLAANALTIASAAADYTAPSGRMLKASGNLTALAADGTGSFDLDVSELYDIQILASAAVDSAAVSIYGSAASGGAANVSATLVAEDVEIGAVEIKDGVTDTRSTVKAASTLPAATDTAMVATLRDTPPVRAAVAIAYRTAVVAADVLAIPGTVTCTKIAGGSATAGTYTVFVVAGNVYGRTTAKQGNTTITTETTNLTVRAAFAAVTGATFYDIYCSVEGAAAKFVGRITEVQRGTGILLSAVNVTSAGGTAGAVDIQVPGTGLAVNGGQLVQNTAYAIPASPVDCSGYQYVDFDLTFSRTGDIAAPALAVIPFFYNARTTTWHAGDMQTIVFGGTSGLYLPMKQRLRLETRGNSSIVLVVASIAGTGASLDIDSTLS